MYSKLSQARRSKTPFKPSAVFFFDIILYYSAVQKKYLRRRRISPHAQHYYAIFEVHWFMLCVVPYQSRAPELRRTRMNDEMLLR